MLQQHQNNTAELAVQVQPVNDAVHFWQICWYHATKTHAEIISNAGITFSGYEKTGRAETQSCHSRLFLAALSQSTSQAGWGSDN